MNSLCQRWLVCLVSLACLSGCLALGRGLSSASPREDLDEYTLIENKTTSTTGCEFDYRVYQPDALWSPTSVVLGHGFMRDQDNMVGLSRALANQGITVITLDFCNMRPWNGNHRRNAMDMRALADQLAISDDVVFGGFSAGALAALLASDNDTRAILALDLVDQNDLGLSAIQDLQTPIIGLSGPPSGCNANRNGDALFESRSERSLSELIQISGASHCEFESPSNWLCELACGDEDDRQTDTAERGSIIELSVSSLLPYLTNRIPD